MHFLERSSKESANCFQKGRDEIFDKIVLVTYVYVVVDTSWPYRIAADYLNYVLQHLNIHPRHSSVTLICGADGKTVVNTTHYLTDFYTKWNVTEYSRCPAGFHLPRLLSQIRDLVEMRLMGELNGSSSSGGSSLVALLMPNPLATITDGDLEYSIRFWRTLNETLPELNFLYYAGGAVIRFQDLVVNPRTDLFPLIPTEGPEIASQPVVDRIRRIPRRLINPRCGVAWETTKGQIEGQITLFQHLRPGGISFYSLLPNYVFALDHPGTEPRRALSIQSFNQVSFTVCTSRSIKWPTQSSSSSPRNQRRCSQILRNNFTLDLSYACHDYRAASNPRDCPPLYVSLQAPDFIGSDEQNACTQTDCRTPDEMTYAMQLKDMTCRAGREKLSDVMVVTVMTLAILLKRWLKIDLMVNS